MHQYQFGKIMIKGDRAAIPVTGDGVAEAVEIPVAQFPEAVVELMATYDIQPCNLLSLFPDSTMGKVIIDRFFASFPNVKVFYDNGRSEYGAAAKNGDTGHDDYGFGPSSAAAVADLIRSQGFKSKLPTTGILTITQWFDDFKYGFQRISDELLQQELDGIFTPDKGAW